MGCGKMLLLSLAASLDAVEPQSRSSVVWAQPTRTFLGVVTPLICTWHCFVCDLFVRPSTGSGAFSVVCFGLRLTGFSSERASNGCRWSFAVSRLVLSAWFVRI